jgi:O-antigen ligase
VLWGFRLWLNEKPQLLWPPICWAVVAFTVYAIIRYRTADIEYVARQELIHILVYALVFLAVLNNLHRQESVQTMMMALIFLAMAISFYAIYQFVTGSDHVWHLLKGYPHRGSGTYICPNHLGGFLEMLLPLGLAYTLASRLNAVRKVFLGYAALVILVGIAVTLSRGSWFSTFLGLMLFFGVLLFHRTHRLPALVLLVLLVGTGVFVMPKTYYLRARFERLWTDKGTVDDDMRLALWEPAMRVWKDQPWFGAGPAHFDYRFRQYRPASVQLQPDRAHNDFLNALADWGLVGAGIIASAWVLLYLGVIKTWRFVRSNASDLGRKPSNKFAFVVGAAAGLAAIFFHSAVDFNMYIPANALLAVSLMALLSSHLRFATERYWISLGTVAKSGVSVVLFAAVVYLGQQGWRRAAETAWLSRAELALACSPAQIACLKEAFVIEPKNAETAYNIGEAYRVQSWAGSDGYIELANTALEWFGKSAKLNPFDAYNFLKCGMCLDHMDRHEEALPYFEHANQLDPNGYFTVAYTGWHYVQDHNYAAAKPWFERSLRLEWVENDIASSYLQIANNALLRAATNEISAKLAVPLNKSEAESPTTLP